MEVIKSDSLCKKLNMQDAVTTRIITKLEEIEEIYYIGAEASSVSAEFSEGAAMVSGKLNFKLLVKDKTEGARFKNIFGTYLHGSLLPKNPHFADLLITLALEKRYNDRIELQKLDDDIELAAHNSLVNKKY